MSKLNQPPSDDKFEQRLEKEEAIDEYVKLLYLAFSSDRGKSFGFFDYFRQKYSEWLYELRGKLDKESSEKINVTIREISKINVTTNRAEKLAKIKELIFSLCPLEINLNQSQIDCLDEFIRVGEQTFFEKGFRENISEAMLWESKVSEAFVK